MEIISFACGAELKTTYSARWQHRQGGTFGLHASLKDSQLLHLPNLVHVYLISKEKGRSKY